jgi:hypothetical protein
MLTCLSRILVFCWCNHLWRSGQLFFVHFLMSVSGFRWWDHKPLLRIPGLVVGSWGSWFLLLVRSSINSWTSTEIYTSDLVTAEPEVNTDRFFQERSNYDTLKNSFQRTAREWNHPPDTTVGTSSIEEFRANLQSVRNFENPINKSYTHVQPHCIFFFQCRTWVVADCFKFQRRRISRLVMMYKIQHQLLDIDRDLYLIPGDSRTRGFYFPIHF